VTPKASVISPGRGVILSPINTQITGTGANKKVRVDLLVSPVMSPVISDPKSPLLGLRNSRSSTPPIWSPETPIAMSFDFPVIINNGTPPLAALSWSDNRETIIEEEIQDATPLELAPPRGRISARMFAPSSSPQRSGAGGKGPSGPARARSMSPPRSAHPDDSSFNWNPTQIHNRHATDEDFDVASPLVGPKQMTESLALDKGYVPSGYNVAGTNPRQTIFGAYFRRFPFQGV
jgi:hypothetical protein